MTRVTQVLAVVAFLTLPLFAQEGATSAPVTPPPAAGETAKPMNHKEAAKECGGKEARKKDKTAFKACVKEKMGKKS